MLKEIAVLSESEPARFTALQSLWTNKANGGSVSFDAEVFEDRRKFFLEVAADETALFILESWMKRFQGFAEHPHFSDMYQSLHDNFSQKYREVKSSRPKEISGKDIDTGEKRFSDGSSYSTQQATSKNIKAQKAFGVFMIFLGFIILFFGASQMMKNLIYAGIGAVVIGACICLWSKVLRWWHHG